MDEELRFRTDLYRGTASFYDRFRLPYPDALVHDLVGRAGLDGHGRLLDLGCGTGQVALALCDHFAEAWAVDQEQETVAFARAKAEAAGIRHVRWIAGRAEAVDPREAFDLVTAGTAFHRLERRRVADLAMEWLPSGRHLALLWSSVPSAGPAPWQRVLGDVVLQWVEATGTVDRVPSMFEQRMAEQPHTRVLSEAGFDIVGRHEFTQVHDWHVASLLGWAYSTSILSRTALGDHVEAFEADVRERLLAIEPAGVFREAASFAYDLARRP